MPKRTDIKSILILGAGPIVIGQACEFDYSAVCGDEADSLPAGRKARGFFTIRQKQHDKLHYLLNFSTIVGEAGAKVAQAVQ